MKKVLLIMLTGIIAASCSAPQRIIYREASGRNIEPAQGAVITPMVADLEIITTESISNAITFDVKVTTAILGEIENYKRLALLNTARKYNADTMVAALTNVDTNKNGYLEITVTGYPAKYVNFHPMTESDLWITQFNDSEKKVEKESKLDLKNPLSLFGGKNKK